MCRTRQWVWTVFVMAGVLLGAYRVHGYYQAILRLPPEKPPPPATPVLPGPLAVAYSPDGRFVLTLDQTGEVRRWEARTGQWVGSFSASPAAWPVIAGGFDATGRRVVTIDARHQIAIFTTKGRLLREWRASTSPKKRSQPLAVAISAGGRWLAHTVAGRLEVWDLARQQRRWLGPIVPRQPHQLAISRAGLTLLGLRSGAVLFDPARGGRIGRIPGRRWQGPPRVAFSRSGDRFVLLAALPTGENQLCVGTSDGRSLRRSLVGAGRWPGIALSADGHLVATGVSVQCRAMKEGLIPEPVLTTRDVPAVWLTSTLRPRTSRLPAGARGHLHSILALAWSPDARSLATVGDDGRIYLWDPESGERLRELIPR